MPFYCRSSFCARIPRIAQSESIRGQCAGIPVSFFEKRLK
jgi:hypothetical protein